ncbi:MAG TPA: metalloregulator ArsR/SmtB family transcription factor [Pseudonocardiaceae bacterium]|nr:metalloregulator ArsR/SmtB family transcription factor [Pseudonocardiaceae bacterium]
MSGTPSPPPFVRLVGDPLRWRLLHELARSDLRVRELVEAVDQPQNVVSYHLAKLRDAQLVRARRSSFSGRDTYYHLDLTHCAQEWADVGAALHPGLRPGAAPPTRPGRTSARVLFLCTGNSGRSPMAEALLRHHSGGAVDVASAGSRPKPLHPNAVRVMAEYGIDLRHEPTHVNTLRRRRFEWVISLCDRVREVCPEFPRRPTMIHWSLPDPAQDGGDDEATLPAYRRTAAELDRRIGFLLYRIAPLATGDGNRP